MSAQAVLFDAPGPKARGRNLVIGVVGLVLILGVVGLLIWVLRDQLTWEKWQPFTDPSIWLNYLYPGLFMTLQAALISVIAATLLGFLLGMGRVSHNKVVGYLTAAFVEFFRAVPVLMMMLFAFYFFLFTVKLQGSVLALAGVVVGLTLYNSCVMAELIRAGVHSLPKGQREAGLAIGLTQSQTLRRILLPQAVTAMLPSLVSQLVVIIKDTALGYLITYPDLVRAAQNVAVSKQNLVVSFLVVAVIFIVINFSLSQFAKWLERRLSRRRAGGRAQVLMGLPAAVDPDQPMYTDSVAPGVPPAGTKGAH